MSTAPKHTPGPWRVSGKLQYSRDGGAHGYVEIGSDKSAFWIAKVLGFTDDPGEYAANARLIAAAPELLEACREMVAAVEIEGANGLRFHEARNSALAAIQKAEGGK